MNYVYIRSEPELWTVGFYDPDGKWHPDSDFSRRTDAANRVHYLNGGNEVLRTAISRVLALPSFTNPQPDTVLAKNILKEAI